ncbi:accessory Sec system glycosyltransferase Asp1 [Lactococcus lactis]|uniref:accessory Sec system glycosyltransferase Asp1 n=1 Tax=Lactococcus lactis TaxID=1358 RepID=UPI001F53D9FE|nr:accessory Sec system glycosyltransferase Asp1 [Lactococcus lactis]MCI1072454.1 accessory Sec system glycosyltransferase Asp1 [Lactococcus lactis]MCT1183475.1 accessory Sec system glycosyltransferase Asp1 [Lactococcus lactis]MCT1194378.1 accessory Sec system glycosyltransferase Asp1 [Lactococcus lactis]
MLYLVPNWSENIEWDEDRLFTLSKFFIDQNFDHQVLLTNIFPFLRYELNKEGYEYTKVLRLFDFIQNIKVETGHPITLEDIDVPQEVDKIFTPTSTILYAKGYIIGKVLYNQFGFPALTRYYLENGDVCEEVYDDRGFVTYKRYINNNNQIYQVDYFNELGKHTLTHNEQGVTVEKEGSIFLKNKKYNSIENIVNEVVKSFIDKKFKDVPEQSISLLTTTDKLILEQFQGINSNVRTFHLLTSEKIDYKEIQNKKIITDSQNLMKDSEKNYFHVPIFYPELDLGDSDSESLMKIFCKISNAIDDKTLQLLVQRVIEDDQVGLILEINNRERLKRVKFLQTLLIEEYFGIDLNSSDYQKVHSYIVAQKMKKLFKKDIDSVKEIQKTAKWTSYVRAVNANLRIQYVNHLENEELRALIKNSRIYLDFDENYSILRHSIAVSSGIPILSIHESELISEGKNGFLLELETINDKLISYVDYFICELRKWNEALVESIDIIEQYNSETIMMKWREIFQSYEK